VGGLQSDGVRAALFYHHTLHRDWMIEQIPYPRHEQKLPVVLSPAEVEAVFEATRNLKHRTILMTIYAAGLRVSELTNLRVTDIYSQRQVICVRQGKDVETTSLHFAPREITNYPTNMAGCPSIVSLTRLD